jgi:hypothetical protein
MKKNPASATAHSLTVLLAYLLIKIKKKSILN